MIVQPASRLGIDVVVAERFIDSAAARLTSRSLVFNGDWWDPEWLELLAGLAPVVTLENEFVDWRLLRSLEADRHRGCLARGPKRQERPPRARAPASVQIRSR
jgi:phosphoribosylaminoimidazole carboxylase (NCAIR synthetase)